MIAALFWAGLGALLSWAFFKSLWERKQAEAVAAQEANERREEKLPEPAWAEDLKLAKQAEADAWDQVWERQREREAATAPVREKLQRAKEVVEELSLQWCLRDLWKELKDGRLSVYEQDAVSRFKNLTREDQSFSHRTISWEWGELSFALEGDEKDYEFHKLSLFLDGDTVLAVTYSADTASDYWSVDALRVGPWMAEAVKMQALLAAESEAFMDRIMDEHDEETAAMISLEGDPDKNQTTTG